MSTPFDTIILPINLSPYITGTQTPLLLIFAIPLNAKLLPCICAFCSAPELSKVGISGVGVSRDTTPSITKLVAIEVAIVPTTGIAASAVAPATTALPTATAAEATAEPTAAAPAPIAVKIEIQIL